MMALKGQGVLFAPMGEFVKGFIQPCFDSLRRFLYRLHTCTSLQL